ncbi:MAG: hypothetical protein AAF329_17635, partial [Cyanobacteria bacterium P01_A01_bin.17]
EYIVATNAVPITGGTLQFQGTGSGNGLVNTYTQANFGTQGQKRYQVIRIPQHSEVTLAPGLTASPWNGSTGGVLALDASGQINLNGSTIDVSGLGFRGGGGRQLTGGSGGADTDYRNLATQNFHSPKAEGIAGTPQFLYDGSTTLVDTGIEGYPNGSHGRGAPGNAGGGGSDGNIARNDQNSGGGGGGNGGSGGQGGNAWNSQEPYGGFGGAPFPGAAQQVVLGGGGGAGTRNNSSGIQSSGGRGGGIVLIRANRLTGTGTINANGTTGPAPANDGAGGGGAGGSVVVTMQAGGLNTLTVNAQGAAGADAWPTTTAELSRSHGPGGGGGGGFVLYSAPDSAPVINVQGGVNGTSTLGQFPFGAQPGAGGQGRTIDPSGIPGTQSGATCVAPQVLLVKRITAVNGNRSVNPNDNTPLNTVVDDSGPNDNHPNWPNGLLVGATDAGSIQPGDELEYTIYALSAGGNSAGSVTICDRIPTALTFRPTAFNTEPPAPGSTAGERGILAFLNRPADANDDGPLAYTNSDDGDSARFFLAGESLPSACQGTNNNGAVVINLSTMPNAVAPENPTDSYAWVRFRAISD